MMQGNVLNVKFQVNLW